MSSGGLAEYHGVDARHHRDRWLWRAHPPANHHLPELAPEADDRSGDPPLAAAERNSPGRCGQVSSPLPCCRAASAVTWTLECLRIHRTDSGLGWDLVTSWRAEQAFVHGSQPYSLADTHHRLFLYPPSSLILMRPIALFSLHGVAVWGLVATAVMTWAAVMISAAALGRRWWGLTAGSSCSRYVSPSRSWPSSDSRTSPSCAPLRSPPSSCSPRRTNGSGPPLPSV